MGICYALTVHAANKWLVSLPITLASSPSDALDAGLGVSILFRILLLCVGTTQIFSGLKWFVRDCFVCCLESRRHYARAEAEAAATLDALCCALSPAAFAKPCRGAASVAPLLPKGKVKEDARVVLLQLAARIAVSNLHKNAKKSFSETIKDMYLHYNERSGLLLCGFQT
nr:uncharacterized protein LOC109782546 [Aegilops tauschii subsp. strangulata]